MLQVNLSPAKPDASVKTYERQSPCQRQEEGSEEEGNSERRADERVETIKHDRERGPTQEGGCEDSEKVATGSHLGSSRDAINRVSTGASVQIKSVFLELPEVRAERVIPQSPPRSLEF